MFKLPYSEINCIPSQLNTSQTTGVSSLLATAAEKTPEFDGISIEQMRGNPIYGRGDAIDKVGMAQKLLADAAHVLTQPKRAKIIRSFNEAAVKLSKPKGGKNNE